MCPEEKDKILVGESKLSETPKKPQYPVTKTKFVYDDAGNSQHEINKKLWEAFQNQIVTSGTTTIGSDGYWYVDGVKTDIKAIGVPGRDGKDGKDGAAGADGKDGVDGKDGIDGIDGKDGKDGKNGRDADVWTIGADDFWYVNGRKTIFKSRGEDGKSPLLRISTDGQSLEISSDGGQTWLPFEKNFNKLRVLGYVSSVQLLPRNANIGDIYGVWNPDVYSGRVDEEGHLIQGAYDLYVNTVRDWVDDYHITKVYDYDTELPSSAANGTTVLVPVDYLTLDKTKIDGYKVYRFSLDRNGWVLILDTAEIYASKEDIINYGDNVFALVQSDEEHTYELYRRDVGWVYFGTNASITYVLVQDIDEATETNILSGKAVTDAYGHYIESPEFVRAYLDSEDKILWGIKTDGTIYYGAGVPPQVKEYIEERIGNYDDITTFLDDLEEGDETLRELLNGKVDKEEGKSLIDEEYAEGVHYIENPEFVEVKLDQNERILEATMLDGTKLLPAGYEVGGNIVKTISNPEYLAAWLDSADHILFALKADGDVVFGCGVPSQIKEHVSKLIEMFHYEDNPEFIDVKLDAKGKILEGVRKNGTKYLGSLDINGITYSVISNPEWLKAVVDSENKIICGIKTDGTFCVVDIDFLVPSNKIKDVLNHFDVKDNPEFLSVELDAEGKILGGRKADGTKFENVGLDLGGAILKSADDPEERIEIKTDSDEKILSYRKEDGTLVENVGIETNHLELTKQGMTDFQQALKDAGFNPGGSGDHSDALSLEIPKPRLAFVNFVNPDGETIFPQAKFVDFKYLMEFYDGAGNYFKKEVIFNAQGQSSMGKPKKNGAIDICNNNGWDDEDTFKLKIGDWVPQDSFHIKAYYTNIFKGEPVVGYQIADMIQKSRGILKDRPWKVGLLGDYTFTDNSDTSDTINDMSLQMDNGARCMPDGFPCIVFLDGDFYGIYSWQLKKHRDNYHMSKSNKNHIHLDGALGNESIFAGIIDWKQFEIRNPKSLCYQELHDGSYKYDADIAQDEIAGTDKNYDGDWSAGSYTVGRIVKHLNNYFINMIEGNTKEPVLSSGDNKNTASSPDFKNKTKCGWVNCSTSVSVKSKIIALSNRCGEITNASSDEERKELINTYFDKDNLIDYILFSQITGNYDGGNKNWQWVTYDGVKWFVCTYDLDGLFGCNFMGVFTDPAYKTHTYDYLLSQLFDRYSFTKYVISLYSDEIFARYHNIRNIGISEDNIINMINSWNLSVGQHYYEKEYKKWPLSECNRDNIINNGWEIVPNTFWGTNPQFDINTTYQAGEECWMSYRKFKATQTIQGIAPYTQLGYHDNIYRISAWLSERFRLLDLYYNYSN